MYSPILREHAGNPRNRRVMENPSSSGMAKYRPCGDTLTLYFLIENDTLRDVSFTARGCGPVVAAASLATTILVGKTVEEARKLSVLELHNSLGGMPVSKRHALLLVLQCLAEALGASSSESQKI